MTSRHQQAESEMAELRSLAERLLERITKLQERSDDEAPTVDRKPPPEAYAKVMSRRRRRGR